MRKCLSIKHLVGRPLVFIFLIGLIFSAIGDFNKQTAYSADNTSQNLNQGEFLIYLHKDTVLQKTEFIALVNTLDALTKRDYVEKVGAEYKYHFSNNGDFDIILDSSTYKIKKPDAATILWMGEIYTLTDEEKTVLEKDGQTYYEDIIVRVNDSGSYNKGGYTLDFTKKVAISASDMEALIQSFNGHHANGTAAIIGTDETGYYINLDYGKKDDKDYDIYFEYNESSKKFIGSILTENTVYGKNVYSLNNKQMLIGDRFYWPYFHVVTVVMPSKVIDVSNANVSGISSSYTYIGKTITPNPTVKYGNTILKKGMDFTVSYNNNTNVGTATVTITGKENYTGTKEVTFKINPAKVTVPTGKTLNYNGSSQTGVAGGTSYTVQNGSATNIGTYTATASLKDTKNYTWSDGTTAAKQVKYSIVRNSSANKTSSNIRVYGSSKFKTAFAVANSVSGKKKNYYDNIVVVNRDNPADAISSGYLAKVKNAPILLWNKDSGYQTNLVKNIKNYMKKGGTVYIMGGTGVIPDSFVTKLKKAGLKSKRVSGKTKYDTNIAALNVTLKTGQDLIIVSNSSRQDSVAGNAIGKPLMMVAKNSLTDAQKKWLKKAKIKNIYIIGDTKAVSTSVENTLKGYGKTVTRISGSNSIDRSKSVADKFFKTAKAVVIVKNYADGLVAPTLARKHNAPVILVTDKNYWGAYKFIVDKKIKTVYIVGGTSAVSDATVQNITGTKAIKTEVA